MQVPQLRRAAASLLAGGLATGLMLLAPASPVAAKGPAFPTIEPLNIVLLGDSYSAGNGATNDAGQPETYGPENCYRSRVNWTEKYAAALRNQGRTVTVENHACSGGRAADIVKPRAMGTASDSTPAPDGVTTLEQADAYLAQEDLCATQTFPDEEFWTYQATSVDGSTIDYDCTRKLKPQVDFITPETDLVLFTMGGNDIGFSNIVTQCFILKSGSGCQGTIETARDLLPDVKQLLLDDIAAIRAAGLRDVTTPDGNADRWINQTGDGTNTSLWYHPNGLGQTAYATVLFRGGDYGATPQSPEEPMGEQPEPQEPAKVRTIFRAKPVKRNVRAGDVVKIRTRVRKTDGSRPRGKVLVRFQGRNSRDQARVSANGRNVLRLKGLQPGRHRIKAVYVNKNKRMVVFTKVVVRRK